MMSREKLKPWICRRFDKIKATFEHAGYVVVSRWKPGLRHIRLGDVVLREGIEKRRKP